MSDARILLMEAIARRRLVEACYNGAVMELAPHLIYERHGELYVSALNTMKPWRSEEERRLGQFKIAGLSATKVLETDFEPLPDFDGTPPRPDDVVVLAA